MNRCEICLKLTIKKEVTYEIRNYIHYIIRNYIRVTEI